MRDSNSNFDSSSGWSRNKKAMLSLAVLVLVSCSFIAQEAHMIGKNSAQAQTKAKEKAKETITERTNNNNTNTSTNTITSEKTETPKPVSEHFLFKTKGKLMKREKKGRRKKNGTGTGPENSFFDALRKIRHYRARTVDRPTVDAVSEGFVAIPPSKMKVHYHEMWNHTTSTIDVPEDYQNPFNVLVVDENGNKRRPLTSLEILHSVLHGTKYKAEFEAVEAYMESNGNAKDKNNANSQPVSVPKCLLPDVGATRDLANRVVQARPERSQQIQQIRNEPLYNSTRNKYMWQFAELMLPLPILNVGFPKVGTTTLKNYFLCTGLTVSHLQEGRLMFKQLAHNISLFERDIHAYTQLDYTRGRGHFPQISLLDELHELEPDSTLVLLSRPIADWIQSTKFFHGMLSRMYQFDVPGIPRTEKQRELLDFWKETGKTKETLELTDTQVAKWWCGHVLHMREYVKEYPSHSLIELDLYDRNGTESLLYDLFQVDADAYRGHRQAESSEGARSSQEQAPTPTQQQCFWGHSNKNKNLTK